MMADTIALQKTLNALGMCAGARKLIIGTPMICEAMRKPTKPYLVVSAEDNAGNTAKKLSDKCNFYNVPMVTVPVDGARLAAAVGKQSRVAAVAITDPNLCKLVRATLQPEEHEK